MDDKIFASFIESGLSRRYFKDSRFNPVVKTDEMTQAVGLGNDGKLYTVPGSGGGAFTVIEEMTADEVSLLPDGAYVSRDNEGTWDYWLKGTTFDAVTIYEFECMDDTTSSFYIHVGTAGNVETKVMIDASGELRIGDMSLYASNEELKFNNEAIALKSDLDDYVNFDDAEEAETLQIDSVVTSGSSNLITSGGVAAAGYLTLATLPRYNGEVE